MKSNMEDQFFLGHGFSIPELRVTAIRLLERGPIAHFWEYWTVAKTKETDEFEEQGEKV